MNFLFILKKNDSLTKIKKNNNIQIINVKKTLNKNYILKLFYKLLYFEKMIFIIFLIFLIYLLNIIFSKKILSKNIKNNNIVNKTILFNDYINGLYNSLKTEFLMPR